VSGASRFRSKAEAERFLAQVERQCERKIAHYEGVGEERVARMWEHAARSIFDDRNVAPFAALGRLKRMPVTIDEFVQSKEFLGELMEVWPTLMPDLRAMNPDVLVGEEAIHEALLGGATGTGKTHLSQITNMYQVYLFTCFNQPQRLFNLAINTPIVFMFQSVSTTITKRVIYGPFRQNFLGMPFTQRWLSYDKYKESALELEDNILIAPALASLQSLVGQAIPGGILDEVNFMSIIEQSKQVAGPTGMGGKYDQAEMVYRNISRRRKRSFLTKGFSLGCLCVVSSTRYRGDFLDRRIDEVREFEEDHILTLRRKQYEVAPPGRYSGETFRVLIGTDDYPTRVLRDEEDEGLLPRGAQVEAVPVELRTDFLRDPEAAQRDYIGIASNAITPFIPQRDRIIQAILDWRAAGLPKWVANPNVDLQADGMPQIVEELLPPDRDTPRYVHIDLSTSVDRCGIAIVSHLGNTEIVREGSDIVEVLPKFAVDLAISIQPNPVNQLDISHVRQWIMQLVSFWGLNIASVSYDGFQSKESMTMLRKAGIRSQYLSADRTTEPYELLKDAIYDGRILLYDNDILRQELTTLEFYSEKKKIDHPPRGCFTGDTLVRLADGSAMRFDEMEGCNGLQILTYGEAGPHEAEAVKPRETMRTRHLVEVELDNSEIVRCTPDHRFLLTDGSYKEAQHLTPDDELQC
jgi:hypothetical protein